MVYTMFSIKRNLSNTSPTHTVHSFSYISTLSPYKAKNYFELIFAFNDYLPPTQFFNFCLCIAQTFKNNPHDKIFDKDH